MIFEFADLINDFSISFKLSVPSEKGYYDAGEWVQPKSITTDEEGALIPLSSKLIYDSGGKYTRKDRQLIILKKIPLKAKVLYNEATYHVEEELPYEDFADFNVYVLRHVDVFEEGEKDELPGD